MLNSKKGESLVEVIIALGIFAFIFVGVVNVIANSITLNLSSRQRTEAVSKTQKKLNEYLASSTNLGACTISGREASPEPITTLEGAPTCYNEELTDSTQTCYWVNLATLDSGEINDPLDMNNTTFIKVVSHGKWYTRMLGEQSFEISRIIRND